jgi:hypothetical protein
MPDFFQELKSKIAGRKVFIIGGGPSLKNMDLSFLNGKQVIVTNNAAELLPEATAWIWADEPWAANNHRLLEESQIRLRFHPKPFCNSLYDRGKKLGYGNCQILHKTGDFGLDPQEYKIRGNNSGANAIHLAYSCKAREILLLGFDMHVSPTGKANYHDKHICHGTNEIYKEKFIPSIKSMADGLSRIGINVYNLNKESSLKCFQFKNIEDFI